MTILAKVLCSAFAIAAVLPLSAQSPAAAPMTLGEWLARDAAASRIEAGEARDAALAALHQVVVQGLAAGREAQRARIAAGGKPDACLPPPGTVPLSSQEIGTWLHTRPASEHGETMTQAIARFLAARFPCPL